MNGYPPWSEANAEELQGEEFIRVRLAYCTNKLAHWFGDLSRGITMEQLSEGLGLAQEVQGFICTSMSIWYEALDKQPAPDATEPDS